MANQTPHRVLPTPESIGDELAGRLLARIEAARAAGRRFLLGCPTGRTPQPIFRAMSARLATRPQDLSGLVLVMMDEYLVPDDDGGLRWAPGSAPWSCHHFARAEIRAALNARLPVAMRVPDDATWFPSPGNATVYDHRIADAGGIDLFLLASGASDGHVAFNPPGSPRESRTRVIPLSEETRRDNLQTFPSFGEIDAVPHYGISVGIDTIVRAKSAIMVVWGAGKRATLRRMLAADRYEPDWPATLIHECTDAEIVSDAAALST